MAAFKQWVENSVIITQLLIWFLHACMKHNWCLSNGTLFMLFMLCVYIRLLSLAVAVCLTGLLIASELPYDPIMCDLHFILFVQISLLVIIFRLQWWACSWKSVTSSRYSFTCVCCVLVHAVLWILAQTCWSWTATWRKMSRLWFHMMPTCKGPLASTPTSLTWHML